MNNNAPVIVFAFRRPVHLARTLSALCLNPEAPQTNVIIFCDHVKADANQETRELMESTREIAHRECRFLSVKVIEREKNFGLAENVVQGVSEVLKEYGRTIVLEDDLLVSPDFLRFMNEALIRYENSEEVACISGYVYPLQTEPATSFFIRGADCWGWATWENKWSILEKDPALLLNEIKAKGLESIMDFEGSYPYVEMLHDRIEGRNNSWAVLWYASALLRNKLCLYPSRSLVQNIGNDGSGTNHIVWSNAYQVALSSQSDFQWPQSITESDEGRRLFISFFNGMKTSLLTKVRRKAGRLISSFKRSKGNNIWSGNYASWQDAKNDCTGYDSSNILEQVKLSVRKVVTGEAAFERDGVAFSKFEYSDNLLSALQNVFHQKERPIKVLDFGGSLGSLFFQYGNLMKGQIQSWTVVEQQHFVESGKKEFENEILRFSFTMEEAIAVNAPDLLILSSVICYLDNPYQWIQKFLEHGIEHVIIDRTAFIQGDKDRLTIQHVPDSIYPATYPAWFLNEEKFLSAWIKDYNIIRELPDSIDGVNKVDGLICYRKGYYFARKK